MWTTMSWQATAAGSSVEGWPFSIQSIFPSGSPGWLISGWAISVVFAGSFSGTESTWICRCNGSFSTGSSS